MAKPQKKTQKKSQAPKGKSLFEHINAVTRDKPKNYWDSLTDTDKRNWSNYMVLRFLSMDYNLLPVVADLQPYVQELRPKDMYKVFEEIIPKKNYYLKYIKGVKTDKYEPWLIEIVTKEYEVSSHEAEEYLTILYAFKDGKKRIKGLAEKYGTETKKIKKLKLGV